MTAGANGSRAPASLALACSAHRRTNAARSSGSSSLPRRVAWLAHWRKLVSARASGARPNCASYSFARRAVTELMLCRRDENSSISACGDAGDLPAVPVRAQHPSHPESAGKGVLHDQGGDRGRGRALPVQGHRVQRPPCAVGLAADLVQDQVVNVELRVAVAAGVLAERGDHPLAGVFPPAAPGVITSPGLYPASRCR